jgi:hypothetical protein
MESKKINQLATNVAPQTSDLTIIGDPITGVSKKITLLQIANLFATTGTVTSVAVTETGDALTITGSPITSAGTINIGFAGDATQYVRGDGALADFPTSTGGGSSVSYYLNSSVSQGTIGGVAYRQLSKTPISGAGTDITVSTNGYIASYITDANDPALLEVPAGNFNCEFYFSVNSNNHNPYVYAELYKYDGTTFTLLGTSQSIPEYLTNGTTLSAYYFAIPVAVAALTITDRLAIRIYANVDTRVVTLHTENNHLCQVVTTFSKGLTSLNNLTRQVQFLATGTSGTDFAISSSTATHTFNLPVASATNTGKLSSTDWSTFNAKQPAIGYTPANDSLVVHLAGNETITGTKFFQVMQYFNTYPIYSQVGIALDYRIGASAVSFCTTVGANVNGLQINLEGGGYNSLNFASTSVGNTYTFPNATGTIALTSNLSSYVPYTGATANVNLGLFDLYAQNVFATDTSGNWLAALSRDTATAIGTLVLKSGGFTNYLQPITTVSSARTWTLPDASGTIALTSNLSAYLPLTGGTLTGALNGTSAVFSSTVQASAYRLTGMTAGSGALYWSEDRVTLANYNATGIVVIEANGGTITSTFGGVTYNNDFVGTGRFTGALTGTSATFSGLLTISRALMTTQSNYAYQNLIINTGFGGGYTNGTIQSLLAGYDTSIYGVDIGYSYDGTGYSLRFSTNDNTTGNPIESLRLLPTGAATFTNNVTSAGYFITPAAATSGGISGFLNQYNSGNASSRSWRTTNDIVAYGDFAIQQSTTQTGSTYDSKLYISSGGNVGIGTTSPGANARLHVQQSAVNPSGGYSVANLVIENTSECALGIVGSLYSSIYFGDAGTALAGGIVYSHGADSLEFRTNNNVERMRLTSGGYAKFTNNGTYLYPTNNFFSVDQNVADWCQVNSNRVTSGTPLGIIVLYTALSPNSTGAPFYQAVDSTALRFEVRSDGGIGNYQANDANLSDERTKKDIIPLESYWDKFKAIEIVKFKYKDQTHDDFNIGVIAQQVEKVAPEFVDVDGWDNKPKLDEDGNEIVSNEEPLKSIYTSDLHHATIKVLQECMAKIEKLTQKVNALENK